ncbi:sulfotransferase family 2 domain-containing protein [Acuticoccus sediminis]|uniref:sulfotransferase family 2 domain-containing protein n=1 Tax=Acuticoccus sediminis TaxID=2184697 RepID=UPI001CFDE4BC|nr:sulfotransferase family 2 domain-containing protein [Acuticoccus sediminis]
MTASTTAPLIVHLHVPKCAGTSINTALSNHFRTRACSLANGREAAAYTETHDPAWIEANLDAIFGHLTWGALKEHARPYVYLSALRDPVDRVCSYFNYVHQTEDHPLHGLLKRELRDINLLDAAFLERNPGVNSAWSNNMSKALSGLPKIKVKDWQGASRQIVDAILDGRFVVGSLGHVTNYLRERGVVSGELPRQNVTDEAKADDFVLARPAHLTPEVLMLLHRKNVLDVRLISLVEHANRIRAARLAAAA